MHLATLLLATLLAGAGTLSAHPHESLPGETERFGTVITEKKPVSLAKLQKRPAGFKGRTLRIEGVVKNVCQGQGCWVEVQDAKGATFMAKSLDESVLLPKDCTGRRIVVQGVVTPLVAKGHDHEHEAGSPPHSCPTPSYVLATQGVELLARK